MPNRPSMSSNRHHQPEFSPYGGAFQIPTPKHLEDCWPVLSCLHNNDHIINSLFSHFPMCHPLCKFLLVFLVNDIHFSSGTTTIIIHSQPCSVAGGGGGGGGWCAYASTSFVQLVEFHHFNGHRLHFQTHLDRNTFLFAVRPFQNSRKFGQFGNLLFGCSWDIPPGQGQSTIRTKMAILFHLLMWLA